MNDALHTSFTRLVGVDYPVVQAGMSWASSSAALPLAVSQAGGLGVLAAGPMREGDLKATLTKISSGTDRPWAVNVPLYRNQIDDVLRLLLNDPPPVLIASQGSPRRYIEDFKSVGTICLHVVGGLEHARKAADQGVDGLVVVGAEAGGHPPPSMVSTLVQVRRVTSEFPGLPIVASGGFADGAGLAAALALGAAAAQFGTRFLATTQANVHPAYKARVLEAGEEEAVTVGHGLGVIRALTNEFTSRLRHAEDAGTGLDERGSIFREASLRQAAVDGDVVHGKVEAGQSAGLISDVRDAGDIVRGIVEEYQTVVRALPGR